MVRINLINPENLADQHLIAEYNEILMLLSYIKKTKTIDVPREYCLGKGHMKFFKDKVLYLKNRHELIKKEMETRGFQVNKKIVLEEFNKQKLKNWFPKEKDKIIIKKRIIEKIKQKPEYYRYYKKRMPLDFFIGLVNKG